MTRRVRSSTGGDCTPSSWNAHSAGFEDVVVCERPGWRDQERAMWEEAAALDPGDDPALRAFHEEGVDSPPVLDLTRRVMASATAP